MKVASALERLLLQPVEVSVADEVLGMNGSACTATKPQLFVEMWYSLCVYRLQRKLE